MQPIRIQKRRRIFDGVAPILPIMRRAYVALIVFATVFSMAWYKKLCNALSWYTMEYPTLVYTTQVNSAFRSLWLVNSEVITKYYSPPSSQRERF